MDIRTFPYALKIATVEDSPIVADRLQQMFSDLNCLDFVGNADCLEDALRLINEQRPAVVILDIHLKANAPHYSGIDLLAGLRTTYPQMVIIMLTNLASTQYRNRCMALGANYFFDKSNEFEKLPETLNMLINPKN